ncbi:MAG: indole-3-glycerol phosphate synthase TrpC [Thermoflavifilum sp.]|nr:indole-3-glycerol phosphate synthase TrpC [Thermoflavifilum sp.]
MASILPRIVAQKRIEIARKKLALPLEVIQRMPFMSRQGLSLRKALLSPGASGIIAEHKRKSPSKGFFASTLSLEEIVAGYAHEGATGLSILTDVHFFGGTLEDLLAARNCASLPILRKDFIVDPYQLYEAKAFGADVVLLIAECLQAEEVKKLSQLAHKLGMEVLMEIHHREQLDKLCDEIDMVGINNRDLNTFQVDVNRSFELVSLVPPEKPVIAESGIHDPQLITALREAGCKGFLIGERFMHQPNPVQAFQHFTTQLKNLSTHAS